MKDSETQTEKETQTDSNQINENPIAFTELSNIMKIVKSKTTPTSTEEKETQYEKFIKYIVDMLQKNKIKNTILDEIVSSANTNLGLKLESRKMDKSA